MGDQESTSLGDIIVTDSSNVLKVFKCCLIKAGNNWDIIYNSSATCIVNLRNEGQWILRLDLPQRSANFDHINIRSEFWGIPDPHTALPPGGLRAGVKFAEFCQLIQKYSRGLLVLAIMIDTARILRALYLDYEKGTFRNTVDTIASIVGAWTGGYLGCIAGAAIGTYFMPGVGTIIGGIIGAIAGSIAGSYWTPKVVGGAVDTVQQLIKELAIDGIGDKDL